MDFDSEPKNKHLTIEEIADISVKIIEMMKKETGNRSDEYVILNTVLSLLFPFEYRLVPKDS